MESKTMLITKRSQSRNLAARAFFGAVLVVCALGLAGATSAGAASYSVYACVGPDDQPLPNSSWLASVNSQSPFPLFVFGDDCGDLSVTANPADSFVLDDAAEYVFDAPSGTAISGYSVTRAASITFPPLTEGQTQLSSGIRESAGSSTTEFDCVATFTDCDVAPSIVTKGDLALEKLAVGVRCATESGSCPEGSFTQLSSRLLYARVDLEDPTVPVITAVGGTLPGSDAPSGIHTLDVMATDNGGGVRTINLAIDGSFTQASGVGGSCAQPYTLRAPCPSALARTLNVHTAGLAAGTHTATLTATDAAGNVSAPYNFAFVVATGGQNGGGTGSGGGTPPSNGSPAVEQPVVKTEKSVISSKNGKNVLVEGTLVTAQGIPIAGAQLDVSALDLGVFDAVPKSIGTTTTTAAGRYSFSVRPDGARRISVLFKPFPTSFGTAVTSTIVREDLTLSVKRSKARIKPGGLLTLSGELEGAGSAADEAPVEIDALIGKSWRAVGVVEANSRGRYKWRYRFTRVQQPTRFTFRAIVRRNKTWPWPTEISKRVKVLVAR